MIEVVWEFVVKADEVEKFARAYARDGPWAKLFSRFDGYLGTRLLRDVDDPNRFVSIDMWESASHRDAMFASAADEYAALDREFEGLTDSEREIGVFETE